ncbi:hypothetical protein Ancab_017805 [Ancistrocladus abbreviatus]
MAEARSGLIVMAILAVRPSLMLLLPYLRAASACYGYADEAVMIAAGNDAMYNGSGAGCGKMFVVTCTGLGYAGDWNPCNGNSVTVKLVHHCPGCQHTSDLFEQAFQTIADTNAGIININYYE